MSCASSSDAPLEHHGHRVDAAAGLLVQVGVDHLAGLGDQPAHPPDRDVLLERRPQPVDLVGQLAGGVLALGRHQCGQLVGQGDELVRLGHEVGLAAQLDDGGRVAGPRRRPPRPRDASRSLRLAAPARPFMRRSLAASSMSPPVSSSAFLLSSMPAPVIWRSVGDVLGAVAATVRPPRPALGARAPGGAAGAGDAPPSSAGAAAGASLAPVLGDEAALDHGVGDHPAHQRTRADGVVVARDHVVDHVGVAVGVDDRDHREAELARLGDRDVLLLGVDHEHRVGQPVEVGDAAEVAAQLLELARVLQRLPLGHAVEVAGRLHGPQLLHALHPARHGGEVGQHAAEPALVDVRHAARLGVLGHRALGLLLRPDEEDRAAVGHQVPDEGVGGLDAAQRLAQVDEIDPVALTQDEALHLRVPSPRLVAEVDPGFQKLSHGNDGHRYVLQSVAPLAQRRPKATTVERAQVMLVGVAAHPCGGPSHASRSVPATLRPGGGSPRRPSAAAPCSRACTPASWPGWRGRAAPGRPAGRHPRRGGGWRRCAAGRAGGWARRRAGRGCAARPAGRDGSPRRFTKAASGGPSICVPPVVEPGPQGVDGGVVHRHPALLAPLARAP